MKTKQSNIQNKESKKVRVLVLADTPTCATGFAQVSKNILKVLHNTEKYDIDVIGINFDGQFYDREKYPYKIYPASSNLIPNPLYQDLFGRQAFLDKLGEGVYDLVWILQDTFVLTSLIPKIVETNLSLPADKKFKTIYYFPIDATPTYDWVDKTVLLIDYPVAYTKYAYEECLKIYQTDEDSLLDDKQKETNKKKYELLKSKLNVIYHGINQKDFFPIPFKEGEREELRKNLFGGSSEKFVFMNMNRNQPRKDLITSMKACKVLLDRRRAKGKEDVYFYFHCLYKDESGLDLIEISKQLKFVVGDEWALPNAQMFAVNHGYPIETVNKLYNAVDCVFSSSLGEGFGLSVVEGMSVKKPVIMAGNTAMNEIIGNNERGLLVKSGKNVNNFVVLANDNNRIRPTCDVNDLADKMEWVMEHKDKVKIMVDNGFRWVSELHWDGDLIGKKWIMLFESAYKEALNDRKLAQIEEETDFTKLGRNDICPVCKIKHKHCIHFEEKEGLLSKFIKKFK